MSLKTTPVSPLQRIKHRGDPTNTFKTSMSMILALIVAVYFILPLYWLFISSTKSTTDLFSTSILALPQHLNIGANLHQLSTYQGGIYWRWFLNSLIYSGGTSVLGTLISAMAGYAIAKYSFRFQGPLLSIIVGGLAIPGAALTIPVFLLVKQLGLINSYAGVILPLLASPFGVYFLSVYIRGAIPNELLDSGRVDGASDFRIFWSIAIPIIQPGLITLFLLSFIGIWNNFFLPLVILSNQNLFPVTLGLDLMLSSLNDNSTGQPLYTVLIMGSALSVLPMLVLFPWLRRYITSGISVGGVKG